MTSVLMESRVSEERTGSTDDDICHTVECHNDDRSLCGLDMTNEPWLLDPKFPCVVCEDLEDLHCGCDCGCCDGDGEEP